MRLIFTSHIFAPVLLFAFLLKFEPLRTYSFTVAFFIVQFFWAFRRLFPSHPSLKVIKSMPGTIFQTFTEVISFFYLYFIAPLCFSILFLSAGYLFGQLFISSFIHTTFFILTSIHHPL